MADIPKASFIICTYNRAEYLKNSLQTLIQSAAGHSVEILVIDNNSTDHTHKVCLETIELSEDVGVPFHYVKESHQGLSYARNRGITDANSPIIIFIDDDINVPESFVKAWLAFFNDHPSVRAAGGKVCVQFDDPRPEWMSSYLLPLLAQQDYGNTIKTYRKSNYPFGVNMAFKADIFSEYGMFNTSLGRIGNNLKASEEKELFLRLHQDDIPIYYVPDAFLHHRVNNSRLTKDYIRRQALGLGQSMALQLTTQSSTKKVSQLLTESAKWIATLGLFLGYLVALQPAKGILLIKFRKWIAEGYASAKSLKKQIG